MKTTMDVENKSTFRDSAFESVFEYFSTHPIKMLYIVMINACQRWVYRFGGVPWSKIAVGSRAIFTTRKTAVSAQRQSLHNDSLSIID